MKRPLTEEHAPGSTAVARFVAVEAYEVAGGQVLRDVFAPYDESGVRFEDAVLLEKLATDRLRAAADELATCWQWAGAMIEVEWSDNTRYTRIEREATAPTDEEQAEIDRLEAHQGELAEMDDHEWTEELHAEAESIETRFDEIGSAIDARKVLRREDLGVKGFIAAIG